MLRIEEIELKDVGRHEYVRKELQGNVIGLVGPSGRGKTTVLKSIEFGLTGTTADKQPLGDLIRRCATNPPKKATVGLGFSADGKKGKIERHITQTGTSRSMNWEGLSDDNGKPRALASDKAVSEAMQSILGVDKKAVNSTVFIKQGEMGKMFGDSLDRRDFYVRLLMLGHLDKIGDIVDSFRKGVADNIQDLDAVKDAADRACDDATAYYLQCREEAAAMQPRTADIESLERLLRALNEQDAAEAAQTAAVARAASATPVPDAAGRSARMIADADAISASRAEHAAAVGRRNNCERDLQSARSSNELFDRINQTSSRIQELTAADDGRDLGQEAAKLRETCDILSKVLPETEALLDRSKADLAAATSDLESVTPKHAAAVEARDTLRNAYAVTKSKVDMLTTLRKDLAGCLDGSAGCPVCGSRDANPGYLDAQLAAAVAERERLVSAGTAAATEVSGLEKVLSDLTATKQRCATMIAAHEDLIKRCRLHLIVVGSPDLASATKALAAVESELVARRAAAQELAACNTMLQSLRVASAGMVARSQEEIAALEKAASDAAEAVVVWDANKDIEEASLRQQAAALRAAADACASVTAEVAASAERVSKSYAAVNEVSAGMQLSPSTATLLTTNQVSSASVVGALEMCRKEQSDYDQARGREEAARKAKCDAETALDAVELKITEQEESRKLASDLALLRDTFRPGGVTMEYLDYRFGQIARLAGDYLATMQADFMVAASSTVPLSYEFLRLDRPDEVWLPQTRLSGGQQVRLAISTILAIHALILPNVGLLVLDEPSTHLGNTDVAAMAEVFKRVGEDGNLQLIVCDHNPLLESCFSDVIELQ